MRHLTESEVAGFLDQDLSADERRRVEAHLDSCGECREELRAVAQLLDQDSAGRASPDSSGQHGGGWRLPVGIAGLLAAAAVATVFLVQPGGRPFDEAVPELERSVTEGVEQLVTHLPMEEAVVARHELRFAWADHGTDSYRLTVMAEDGALLWSRSLADTTAIPPAEVELPTDMRLFWYVDAMSGGVVARTGARTFRLEP